VPFIRYSRDKRGNETTYVMHAYRAPDGSQQTRVLYLFRSPAHVRMGRRPLDEEAREALEHTHPDLSFDWTALTREGGAARAERFRERRTKSSRPAAAAPPQPAVLEDHSLLGRTIGAAEAARLRARFTELVERIGRRARTPEQRDRLIEAAQRLNPDEWPDAEAIRAHVDTFDADCDALAAELPARRRSRRGRRREAAAADGTTGTGAGEAAGELEAAAEDESADIGREVEEPDEGSAIMPLHGDVDEAQDAADAAAPPGGGPGDDASAVRSESGADGGRAGHDVPDDDELR
jgi:hypothetical protein